MREIKRQEGGETGKGKREGKERNGKGTGRDTGRNTGSRKGHWEQEGTLGAIMKDWGVEWFWGLRR